MTYCDQTDLRVDHCAHCRGDELPAGAVPHWTTSDPTPPPRTVPVVEAADEPSSRWFPVPVLRSLHAAYVRLFAELPAASKGTSNDNSTGFTVYRDPRRAPVKVEVLDLIAKIETEIPDLSRWLCEACRWVRCVAPAPDTAEGRRGTDPRLEAALETLSHYWPLLEDYAADTAEAIHGRCSRLLDRAERLLGDTAPAVPLDSLCPACSEPSIFRVDTGRGFRAACCNPDCRREWSETEWEDSRHPVR